MSEEHAKLVCRKVEARNAQKTVCAVWPFSIFLILSIRKGMRGRSFVFRGHGQVKEVSALETGDAGHVLRQAGPIGKRAFQGFVQRYYTVTTVGELHRKDETITEMKELEMSEHVGKKRERMNKAKMKATSISREETINRNRQSGKTHQQKYQTLSYIIN